MQNAGPAPAFRMRHDGRFTAVNVTQLSNNASGGFLETLRKLSSTLGTRDVTTDGDVTYDVEDIVNYNIHRSGLTADRTDTLPAAADIGTIENLQVGSAFPFAIYNGSSQNVVVQAGTNGTNDASLSARTVAPNSASIYFVRLLTASTYELGALAHNTDTITKPASSTDNAIARWNGTDGGALQDSGALLDNSNNLSGLVNLTATGTATLSGLAYPTADGAADGDLLKTNAAGTLSFITPPSIGLQTLWIPAATMLAAFTNGPASADVEGTGSPPVNYTVLDFDQATQESAHFDVAFPKSWNEGTVTFQAFWTTGTSDSNDVTWGLQAVAVAQDDPVDATFGSAGTSTSTASLGAGDLYVSPVSDAITIAGSPSVDELVTFRLYRDVSIMNNHGADARLRGIKLFFTTNAANDA